MVKMFFRTQAISSTEIRKQNTFDQYCKKNQPSTDKKRHQKNVISNLEIRWKQATPAAGLIY